MVRHNANYGDRSEGQLDPKEIESLTDQVTQQLATKNGDSGECTVSTRQLALLLKMAVDGDSKDFPSVQLSNGLAYAGDEVLHSALGPVVLEFSSDRGWHYLRLGYAGYDTDIVNLSIRTCKTADSLVTA